MSWYKNRLDCVLQYRSYPKFHLLDSLLRFLLCNHFFDRFDEFAPVGGTLIHLPVFIHDPAADDRAAYRTAKLPAFENLHNAVCLRIAIFCTTDRFFIQIKDNQIAVRASGDRAFLGKDMETFCGINAQQLNNTLKTDAALEPFGNHQG